MDKDNDKNTPSKNYSPSTKIKKRLKHIQDRIGVMEKRKTDLGINKKCDRMDILFAPHMVSLDQSYATGDNGYYVDFDNNDDRGIDEISVDRRKSVPLLYEKVTTAVASMFKNIPIPRARAYRKKYEKHNLIVEKAYYENWESNRLLKQAKRLTFGAAKYGIAYGWRFIKKTYKTVHVETGKMDDNGKPIYKKEQIYKCNDTVWEYINPRYILMDDSATEPADANDCAKVDYMDQATFDSTYPKELYPDAIYVRLGGNRLVEDKDGTYKVVLKKQTGDHKDKIEVFTYQNENDDTEEIVAGGVYLEEHPLPGHTLSLWGAKWISKSDECYDGIGIGDVVEIYQPINDDILNNSNERLRQLVRPVRVMGNDVSISNDEDFVWRAGKEMRVEGDISQIKWDRPPVTSGAEITEREMLSEEIDVATFVPKALSGLDVSDTAYQAAQNRESALKKLALPLDNIKEGLEDDANIAFKLFRILYSEPIETEILKKGDDEFEEAQQMTVNSPDDERFTAMKDGTIGRRRFREIELPLSKEMKKDEETGEYVDTGKVVEVEEREFWEMIPEHWNWEGYINVEPMSFIPVSEALETEQKKERATILLEVPDTDEMGNPTLKDENGTPYRINRVKAIKDYVEATNADPDSYVVPIEEGDQVAGDVPADALNNPSQITPRDNTGLNRPEIRKIK